MTLPPPIEEFYLSSCQRNQLPRALPPSPDPTTSTLLWSSWWNPESTSLDTERLSVLFARENPNSSWSPTTAQLSVNLRLSTTPCSPRRQCTASMVETVTLVLPVVATSRSPCSLSLRPVTLTSFAWPPPKRNLWPFVLLYWLLGGWGKFYFFVGERGNE